VNTHTAMEMRWRLVILNIGTVRHCILDTIDEGSVSISLR